MTGKRKKTRSRRPDPHPEYEADVVKEIQHTEGCLNRVLSPIEPYVMGVQSILVWENPQYTAAMLVCVNILFWLATTTRIYHLIGLTGLTIVIADMWTTKIWPEIRVPVPPNEEEEWTPVHPRLLSVPELCRHTAEYWVVSATNVRWAWKLRRESKFKFFVLMSVTFGSLAVLGTYISDILLLYIIVMGLLSLPAVIYHGIPNRIWLKIEPHMLRVEQALSIKRTKTKKALKRRGSERKSGKPQDSDSDEDIKEFIPEPDPDIKTALKAASKAAYQESEDEEALALEEAAEVSALPSNNTSDNESHTDDDFSFSAGLRRIPGHDDSVIDDSDNAAENGSNGNMLDIPDIENDASESDLDLTLTPSKSREASAEPEEASIKFVPTHFKESSDSDIDDEDKMAQGLDFSETQEGESPEKPAQEGGILGQLQSQMQAAIAAEIVSQTMSSLMSNTLSGLNKLGQSVRGTAGGGSDSGSTESLDHKSRKTLSESIDSEFEFLDKEDLENVEEMKGLETDTAPGKKN